MSTTAIPSPLGATRAPPRRAARLRVLPGLGISLGWALGYLALMVVVPLGALIAMVARTPFEHTWAALTAPRTLASFGLSFGAALAAAVASAPIGLLIAWVLARYRFPGRAVLDAIVDLPFALPTAVSGIALTFLYSPNGWMGSWLSSLGIEVAFTRLGIVVALVFVGIPFVIRTVQPVIEDLDAEVEEAAACLGASKLATFRRVIFPAIAPALITGVTLAFARAVGEYGSIVFIAGNMPMRTEIAPLLIITKLEQFDYAGAAAVAVGMLSVSLVLLLVVNAMQRRLAKRGGAR